MEARARCPRCCVAVATSPASTCTGSSSSATTTTHAPSSSPRASSPRSSLRAGQTQHHVLRHAHMHSESTFLAASNQTEASMQDQQEYLLSGTWTGTYLLERVTGSSSFTGRTSYEMSLLQNGPNTVHSTSPTLLAPPPQPVGSVEPCIIEFG